MNLLAPAPAYALAGLQACLVGPWVAGATYVYASAQLDILNELDPAAVWWPVDCQQAEKACEFGEAYAPDKNGDAYTQTISLALPGLAAALRAGLQNFIGRPLLALCKDMRGQWWLLGQDAGLRLPSYAAKSGAVAGETLTSWLLTGRQLDAARQVALDGPITAVDYGFHPGSGPGAGSGGSQHTFPFTLA
jgi:hypothetical protein